MQMKFWWQAPKCLQTCKKIVVFSAVNDPFPFSRLFLHDDDNDEDLYERNPFLHRPEWAKASMTVVSGVELGKQREPSGDIVAYCRLGLFSAFWLLHTYSLFSCWFSGLL